MDAHFQTAEAVTGRIEPRRSARGPQRRLGRLVAVAGVAVALVIAGPAFHASAASTTWKDGNTTSCSTYSEATAYQSRTGIRAYLPAVWSFQQVQLRVWFGTANTTQWSSDVTVSNTRSYGSGKFTWRNDTCEDKTRGVGQALNVGGLARAASIGAADETDISRHQGIVDAASGYGLDISQAELLADDGATKIWTITVGEEVFFATARGEFTTLARTTAAQLATHAYTVLIEDEGTAAQYVIVDEAHVGAARAVGGLRGLTSGVFVDDAVNARASSKVTTLRGDADSTSPGYDLALFSPEAK